MASHKRDLFFFDHLPKTGGTSFRVMLEKMFGPKNVSPHIEGHSEAWAARRYAACRVISGHFVSHVPGEIAPGGRARLVLLRHPVDRAISEYLYRRHHSFEGVDDRLSRWAQQYDICTFFRMRDETDETAVRNYYTKHFATRISRSMGSDEAMLTLAVQALDSYDFAGVSERMRDSVDVFCWQFALPPVDKIPLENVTSSRAEKENISAEALSTLRDMNDFDLQLYEHALKRLEEKRRRMIDQLLSERAGVKTTKSDNGHGRMRSLAPRALARLARKVFSPPAVARDAGLVATEDSPDAVKPATPPSPPPLGLPSPSGPVSESFGNREIEILRASVAGLVSGTNAVAPGEQVTLGIQILARRDETDLTVGFELRDVLGEVVFGTNSYLQNQRISVVAGRKYEIAFAFQANLNRGRYDIGAALHTGADHSERCYHWADHVTQLDVVQLGEPDFVGYCRLEPRIECNDIASSASDEVR